MLIYRFYLDRFIFDQDGIFEVELAISEANPTDSEILYNLNEGQNLISYIGSDNVSIQDAISDEVEELFLTIIGQGQAAQRLPNGLWVGSLQTISPTSGYWLKLDEPEGELLIQHLTHLLQDSFKLTDSIMEKAMRKRSHDAAPPQQHDEPSELTDEDEDDLW